MYSRCFVLQSKPLALSLSFFLHEVTCVCDLGMVFYLSIHTGNQEMRLHESIVEIKTDRQNEGKKERMRNEKWEVKKERKNQTQRKH